MTWLDSLNDYRGVGRLLRVRPSRLRTGNRIRQHRVFYEVDEDAARVRIVAVGYKEHNKLFIGGEKFDL